MRNLHLRHLPSGLLLSAALLFPTALPAYILIGQDSILPFPTVPQFPTGEASVATTVTLRMLVNVESTTSTVLTPISLPKGTKVRLQLGDWAAADAKVVWTSSVSAQPLASSDSVLEIKDFQASDAATYSCTVTDSSGKIQYSERVNLALSLAQTNHKVAAVSSLVRLSGNQTTAIVGFSVVQETVQANTRKHLLIRAIGPSLSLFGVNDGLARPKMKILNSSGTEANISLIGYIAGGSGSVELDQIKAGLTPIPYGTQDSICNCVVSPGTYSVHVTSENGGTGQVLIEIYEVP